MDVQAEITIAAPIEHVFYLVDDPRQMARWQPMPVAVMDEPTPRVPGHRFVMRFNSDGRDYDSTSTILARNAPMLLVLATESRYAPVVTSEWRLLPTEEGTKLAVRSYTPPKTGLDGFFDRVFLAPRGNSMARRALRDQLALIREFAEGRRA